MAECSRDTRWPLSNCNSDHGRIYHLNPVRARCRNIRCVAQAVITVRNPALMQESGIPVPHHIVVSREPGEENKNPPGFEETEDYVAMNGEGLHCALRGTLRRVPCCSAAALPLRFGSEPPSR